MAVYPSTPPVTKPAKVEAAVVTPKVTAPDIVVPAKPLGIAPQPLFQTTTEDAPDAEEAPNFVRKLSPKTLAEHAAGKEAISQYAPQE